MVNSAWGQVVISQYIETNSGSTPKGIEVFNNSGSDIVFSTSNKLEVYQGINGAACALLTSVTSGTLQSGKVWVIGTSDLVTYATSNGTNLSGTTTYAFTYNGDDAMQLYLGGVLKDVFGTCGVDPGSSWTGNGVSTADQNIQLKAGVCSGTTSNWSDPSLRFELATATLPASTGGMAGFGNSPSCSLPVSFSSFLGKRVGKSVLLTWSTASEEHNRGFDVQRSTDGVNYTSLGFVNSLSSTGNSSSALNYSFIDYDPIGLKQYYRLKQTDFDGTSRYSGVVVVTNAVPERLAVTSIYPNPASSFVHLSVASPSREAMQLIVTDANGRTVRSKYVNAEVGNNSFEVEVAGLGAGIYYLSLRGPLTGWQSVGKFVKN